MHRLLHRQLLWLWKNVPFPLWTRRLFLRFFARRFLIGALAIVQDEQQRVLFVRQTYKQHRPWGLPGGWIKSAETPEQGLAREVAEETGLSVRVGPVAAVKAGPYGEIIVAYHCAVVGGELKPDPVEISELRYFGAHERPDAEPLYVDIAAEGLSGEGTRQAILPASFQGERPLEQPAAIILERFRDILRQLRRELEGMPRDALHWTPGPETSTIAILVAHVLGSELDTLRRIRGLPSDRVRATEFERRDEGAEDLLRRIDAAEAELERLAGGLTTEHLAAPSMHATRGTQPGWFWLIDNYGHQREHLAQLQLTKQMFAHGETAG
jgi:ADP-ribose pyrophosphatase YjhB (NUDIX family)